jgi:DNA-binding SARP family transcriptional activator/tetratricopeptide (TPR) repeat protein
VPVTYRVLGEFTMSDDGGQLVSLPGGAALRVFTALLVNANKRTSKANLRHAGWGHIEIDEVQLHKAISAIRNLLERVGRRDDLITHARVGYELRVPEEACDMLMFRRLIRQAEEAATAGHVGPEIDLLRGALRQWRGRYPWANVDSDAFLSEASSLTQRRKRAAVRLFELELGRGVHDTVIDDLSTVAGYHPTDKRLLELLMIALFRHGHTTEALAAYGRHAAALKVTHAQPEAGPRELRMAVSAGDGAAVDRYQAGLRLPGGPAVVRAAPAAPRVPRELPPAPGDFVGRDNLVPEATWLLGRRTPGAGPVVVITGSGGVGKTTLALHVAHLVADRYPDGQLYVELHDATGRAVGADEVLAQFLRSFDVLAVPEARAERASLLRTVLADRRVLLLLDDAHDEGQIRDLIPGNADCGVIVTTRRRLPGLSGAHHVAPLEPLESTVARQLFQRIIRRAGVEAPADLAAAEAIVALCAGLPLAIRIAAALQVREAGRPTADLAERLARQGPEAFAYGELSVARTIGASLDRLDDDARALFLGLGRLRLPHFGLWTAAAVLPGGAADPADALSQLIATSIVVPAGPVARYRFHDLTREYASRRSQNTGPTDADVASRVYRGLLTLARRAHRGLYGGDFEVVHGDTPDWAAPAGVLAELDRSPMAWYEAERANIRAAVEHCAELGLIQECWDLAVSAHEFYNLSGYFDDWHATHTRALRACRSAGDQRGEGVLLAILGQPALAASRRTGQVSGPDELRRAAELLEECGDRHGQAIAQRTLANALRRRGQLARPLRLFREAQANYEASGDAVGSWQALRFVGQTHLDRGEWVDALRVLAQARVVAGVLDRPRLLAQSNYWLGQAHLAVGEVDQAEDDFQAMADPESTVDGPGHAYALHGLGDVARLRGELAEARRRLERAAGLAHTAQDAVLEGRVHLSLAGLAEARARPAEQLRSLESAAECFGGGRSPSLEAASFAALGRALEGRGRTDAARRAWDRVESLYREMNLPPEDRIHHRGR